MWKMWVHMRTLKYFTPKHLKALNSRYSQICAKWKLTKLCERGYLKNTYDNIYIATDKVLPALKAAGYLPKILPAEPEGKGDINELNNTDHFVKALKLRNFKALLFPKFPRDKPYIIPDGLLILAEKTRYRLVFLEIESKKDPSVWRDHLETKRENYNRLATDIKAYSYWKYHAPLLALPVPEIEDFCFSVLCLGEFTAEWPGWTFKEGI